MFGLAQRLWGGAAQGGAFALRAVAAVPPEGARLVKTKGRDVALSCLVAGAAPVLVPAAGLAVGLGLCIVLAEGHEGVRQTRSKALVRQYVRRGVPPEQAAAEAAAWAELERTFAHTTLDLASCAAACAATVHAPWNRQFQELLQLLVRLQAARRGSIARSTYLEMRQAAVVFQKLYRGHRERQRVQRLREAAAAYLSAEDARTERAKTQRAEQAAAAAAADAERAARRGKPAASISSTNGDAAARRSTAATMPADKAPAPNTMSGNSLTAHPAADAGRFMTPPRRPPSAGRETCRSSFARAPALDFAHAARKSAAEQLAAIRLPGDAAWGTAPAPAARHTAAVKEATSAVLKGPERPQAQQSWAARAAKVLPALRLPYARGAKAVAAALTGCCNPGGQHCAFIALLAALTAVPELVDALLALPDCEKADKVLAALLGALSAWRGGASMAARIAALLALRAALKDPLPLAGIVDGEDVRGHHYATEVLGEVLKHLTRSGATGQRVLPACAAVLKDCLCLDLRPPCMPAQNAAWDVDLMSGVVISQLQAGWTLQKVLEIPLSPCPCAVCEWATAEGQPPKRLHAPLPRSAAVAYSYLAVPPTSLTEALELLAAIQEEVTLRAAAHGSAAGAACRYLLAALLMYRGEHWVALVRHGGHWYLANDATVKSAGASFASACQEACKTGLWAPGLALYAARPRDAAACAGAGGPWDPIGRKVGGACEAASGSDGWEEQRLPRKGRA